LRVAWVKATAGTRNQMLGSTPSRAVYLVKLERQLKTVEFAAPCFYLNKRARSFVIYGSAFSVLH